MRIIVMKHRLGAQGDGVSDNREQPEAGTFMRLTGEVREARVAIAGNREMLEIAQRRGMTYDHQMRR
jgi:hypothetical protein